MNTASRAWYKADAKKDQGDEHEMKTACASACIAYFGLLDKMRYLHTINDIVNGLRRNGYSVRSRKSSIKKDSTVGSVRTQLANLEPGIYLVRVPGHAMLMNHNGETIVDTDPRKRDRRRITHIYLVRRSMAGEVADLCNEQRRRAA